MPLYANAELLIRGNLAVVKRGTKPRPVRIGELTDAQVSAINAHRRSRNLGDINKEILFVGKHLYDSRVLQDGYEVNDVIKQITGGLDSNSQFIYTSKMTVLQNPKKREDGYGNRVSDQAILECTTRFPYAELYSAIPKGDKIKPAEAANAMADAASFEVALAANDEGSHTEAAPLEVVTNPPG